MPAEYYDFSNDAQLIGAATITLLLHLSVLFLIFRLALARSVKRFFHYSELPEPQKDPNNPLNPTLQKYE